MLYNRYRSDSKPQADAHFLKKEWTGSQLVVDSVATLVKLPAESRQCYDTVTEDFHKKRAAGAIFNNEFFSSKTTFQSGGNYRRQSQYNPPAPAISTKADWSANNGYVHAALFQKASDTVVMDDSGDLQKAQIAALGAVNKTDIDAGAFAAEWGKTRSLFRDLGNGMLKLIVEGEKASVKRGRTKKIPLYDARGNPVLNRKGNPVYRYSKTATEVVGRSNNVRVKNTANLWLAGRYGLMPLLYDLESAWKYLCKNYSERQTARGFVFSVGRAERKQRWANDLGYFDIEVKTTRTLSTRVGILYDTDAVSRALAGLGLTRPLSTAWELVSLSFVLDWWIDIGSWLDAMQPAGFNRNLCAWVSTTEVIATTTTSGPFVRTVNDGQYASTSASLSDWSAKTVTNKHRYPWDPELPKFPALGQGFNLMRSADFAALVAQKIRTRL